MGDSSEDFLTHYRNINSKLKKRFLRKPNVADASEQFGVLGKSLQTDGFPQYTAFCSLAVGRCEHTLTNVPGEVASWIEAARSFLLAESEMHTLGCSSFEEHLQAAVDVYNHAIAVHLNQGRSSAAAALCLELGDSLCRFGRINEAATQYARAADSQTQFALHYLYALEKVIGCKVAAGDYNEALVNLVHTATVAIEQGGNPPHGVYSDILARCEITQVLLLLILEPSPHQLSPEQGYTLERYAWSWENESCTIVPYLTEDLFVLLQSLVIACQSKNIQSLEVLEDELWNHLNHDQHELLCLLVTRIKNKCC